MQIIIVGTKSVNSLIFFLSPSSSYPCIMCFTLCTKIQIDTKLILFRNHFCEKTNEYFKTEFHHFFCYSHEFNLFFFNILLYVTYIVLVKKFQTIKISYFLIHFILKEIPILRKCR